MMMICLSLGNTISLSFGGENSNVRYLWADKLMLVVSSIDRRRVFRLFWCLVVKVTH